jgi:cellulose biosynthesis protein BcsQ
VAWISLAAFARHIIMPLQSGHVFASHIGHTGKTTLCFQMSSYYAKRHPDLNVLVMDLAEEGDCTKRLLGGVDNAAKKVDELFGTVFKLLADADKKSTARGLTNWLWSTSNTVDITQYAIRLNEHNPSIPPNLFLISSGAWPTTDKEMSLEERQRICSKIQESLDKSESVWKLFCDTDGDRRPSTFTKIGYGLCAHAIVPLHLNKGDLDRTETMMGVMNELRRTGEISTQVLFIVWNFVKSNKDEPMVHNGTSLSFTPTKVNLDILDACNTRLLAIRKDLPGIFVHDEAPDADFIKASTVVLRSLADNVLKPSEELGKPFVQIVDDLAASGKKTMKFNSGGTEYSAADSVIANVDNSLREIEAKFEAMSLGPASAAPTSSGYPGGQ